MTPEIAEALMNYIDARIAQNIGIVSYKYVKPPQGQAKEYYDEFWALVEKSN